MNVAIASGVDELAPALLRVADGDEERLVRGDPALRLDHHRLVGKHRVAAAHLAVDVVERRVRARRAVGVGEGLGPEHDERRRS